MIFNKFKTFHIRPSADDKVDKNMKILLSTSFIGDSFGGIPKVVMPLYAQLNRESFGDFYLLHSDSIREGQKKIGLISWISKLRPDVVHDHGTWLPFHLKVFIAAKLFGVPFVMSPHGSIDAWAMAHKGMKKKIAWHGYQKYIIRFADAVVVNSQLEYLRLRELGFNNPVAIIENGVEFPQHPSVFESKPKEITRKALFFSRINPKKGILELLLAWKNSQARVAHGYTLNIYGNSDDAAYLALVSKRIVELKLSDSVFLKGPIYGEAKWTVFAEHDFFILPSYSENFGIVVAEALFSGLPVITTDTTPWQHLEALALGRSVSLKDQSLRLAIDERIETLVKDGGLSVGSRVTARKYVVENFSWTVIALKYVLFYEWILGKAEKPDFLMVD